MLKDIKVLIWLILGLLMVCIINSRCEGGEMVKIEAEIIKQIESSGNRKAYNPHSDARGLFQITPICLEDYNQYHYKKYELHELYRSDVNRKVYEWYMGVRIPILLKHYGHEDNVYNRIVAYNAGIKYVGKEVVPTETVRYYAKYNKLLKKGEL